MEQLMSNGPFPDMQMLQPIFCSQIFRDYLLSQGFSPVEKHLEVALGKAAMGNFQSQLKLKSLFSSFECAISEWLHR